MAIHTSVYGDVLIKRDRFLLTVDLNQLCNRYIVRHIPLRYSNGVCPVNSCNSNRVKISNAISVKIFTYFNRGTC
ncbi:hypothetical protein D3C75_1257760 [compost metagenome]